MPLEHLTETQKQKEEYCSAGKVGYNTNANRKFVLSPSKLFIGDFDPVRLGSLDNFREDALGNLCGGLHE